ncbi:hypothetical protein ABTM83_20140, partial [Acinetobacter baumannii]
ENIAFAHGVTEPPAHLGDGAEQSDRDFGDAIAARHDRTRHDDALAQESAARFLNCKVSRCDLTLGELYTGIVVFDSLFLSRRFLR